MTLKIVPRTLVFLIDWRWNVLLWMKKVRHGKGFRNGFWGKIDEGETPLQWVIRELEEEAGIRLEPNEVEKKWYIYFERVDEVDKAYPCHLYMANYEWGFVESEEMRPQRFPIADIPYDDMWADDKHWIPDFINGKFISMHVKFVNKRELGDFDLKTFDEEPDWNSLPYYDKI